MPKDNKKKPSSNTSSTSSTSNNTNNNNNNNNKNTSERYSASGTNVEEEEASLIKRSSKYIRSNINNYEKEISYRWKVFTSIFENLSLMCWLLIGFLIFACLIVMVLAEGRNRNNPLVTGVETAIAVRKGDTDPRAYQFSVLENGLQILLISDPNTDKAAAAMDVRVGHFSDPDNIPGLSHLLEHMLFLGTEKFPEEDAFDKFLSRHGGMSNAYTSKEDTNYHFEVLPNALEKSLEMFASFFIAPLLTPERIDRERKAVDSENEKNLQNDDWRFTQLLRSTSNNNHPYHKYGTGNKYTLKDFGGGGDGSNNPSNTKNNTNHNNDKYELKQQQQHNNNNNNDNNNGMVDETTTTNNNNNNNNNVHTGTSNTPKTNGATTNNKPKGNHVGGGNFLFLIEQLNMMMKNNTNTSMGNQNDSNNNNNTTTTRSHNNHNNNKNKKENNKTTTTTTTKPNNGNSKLAKKHTQSTSLPPPVTLHQALVNHHHSHYTAPRMRLVILGRDDVTQLESLARQYFSEIPNRKDAMQTPTWDYPKLKVRTVEQLGVRYDITPIEDVRVLQLYWLLPPSEKKYRKKTMDYLSTILAGEGEGSIHAALHQEGLVTEITGGAEDGSSVHNWMALKLYLTAKGLEKVEHIVTVVYAYINMLRSKGPQMGYWLECKGMAEVDLRFVEKKNPAESVSDLAQNMQVCNPGDVVVSENLWEDFDAKDIRSTMDKLQPDNMVLFVAAKSLDLGASPKMEKWYGTRYISRPLSYDSIAMWTKASVSSVKEKLHFPLPNLFIPTDFNIKSGLSAAEAAKAVAAKPQTYPHVLENRNHSFRAWFKQDDTYGVPKVNVLASLHLEHFGINEENMVHATLFSLLIKDYLRVKLYPATVAGISYNVEATSAGLQIQIIGYNHHIRLCMQIIVKTIVDIVNGNIMKSSQQKLDFQARLELLMDRYDKELKNWAEESPYKHAKGYSAYVLRKPYFLPTGLLKVVEKVTMDSMIDFIRNSLSRKCFLQTLYHGNMDESAAKQMQEDMGKLMKKCQPMLPKSKRVRSITPGGSNAGTAIKIIEPNQGESNSAIVNTYQLGTEDGWDNLEKTCQTKVLAALTGTDVYEQLRTIEQLGYIVFSGPSKTNTMLNFIIIVQGTKNSPAVLDERIELFIKKEYKKLQAIPEEKFNSFIASEISRLKSPYKTLTDESSAYWSEIEGLTYLFARPFKEIEQFEKITVQEVTALWGDNILNPNQRKKLSVQIYGNKVPPPVTPDTDETVDKLRSGLELANDIFPVPQSIAEKLGMLKETPSTSSSRGGGGGDGSGSGSSNNNNNNNMMMGNETKNPPTASTGADGNVNNNANGTTADVATSMLRHKKNKKAKKQNNNNAKHNMQVNTAVKHESNNINNNDVPILDNTPVGGGGGRLLRTK